MHKDHPLGQRLAPARRPTAPPLALDAAASRETLFSPALYGRGELRLKLHAPVDVTPRPPVDHGDRGTAR